MAKSKGKGKSKKTNNSKRIEEVVTTDGDLMDKFFIVAGVILFLLCFYILTVYITNKNNDDTEKEKEKVVEINNEYILLGRSLSMGKGDYYVIYFHINDSNIYDEIVKKYGGELPIYKVDMSIAFNKKFATDGESNKNPTKISEFKINRPTLIRVSNKKVVEYIEGEGAIRTILN